MAVSWTDDVTGPSEVPEAVALLAVLERYHQRVVEQLAVTDELLGQAGQLDGGAEGVAETLALLEAVAGHLRNKDHEVRELMGSLRSAPGEATPTSVARAWAAPQVPLPPRGRAPSAREGRTVRQARAG